MGVAAALRRSSGQSAIRVPPPDLPLRGGGGHRGFPGLRQIGLPDRDWGAQAPRSPDRKPRRDPPSLPPARSVPPPIRGRIGGGRCCSASIQWPSGDPSTPSQPPPDKGEGCIGACRGLGRLDSFDRDWGAQTLRSHGRKPDRPHKDFRKRGRSLPLVRGRIGGGRCCPASVRWSSGDPSTPPPPKRGRGASGLPGVSAGWMAPIGIGALNHCVPLTGNRIGTHQNLRKRGRSLPLPGGG